MSRQHGTSLGRKSVVSSEVSPGELEHLGLGWQSALGTVCTRGKGRGYDYEAGKAMVGGAIQ
jgi:hypothetical protein